MPGTPAWRGGSECIAEPGIAGHATALRLPAHTDTRPGPPPARRGRAGQRRSRNRPGPALIALLGELDVCGLRVSGMVITRLQGTLTLPDGLLVRYSCGWLVWPTGRPSCQGRPLHTLHSVHDLAGAARRLAQHKRNEPPGWSDHD